MHNHAKALLLIAIGAMALACSGNGYMACIDRCRADKEARHGYVNKLDGEYCVWDCHEDPASH